MPIKVKTIAREATEEALATSLRQAISAHVVAKLSRALSEAPLRDELARVIHEAVTGAIAAIDWGSGRPCRFSAKVKRPDSSRRIHFAHRPARRPVVSEPVLEAELTIK